MGSEAVLDLVLSGMWLSLICLRRTCRGGDCPYPVVLCCYKHCPLSNVTCYPEPKICGDHTEESVGVHQTSSNEQAETGS